MSEPIYSADPYQEFELAEAARESRRARRLSRAEGRAVDSYGFAAADKTAEGEPAAGDDRPSEQVARWTAEARAAAAARADERRLFASHAFEMPAPASLLTTAESFPDEYSKVKSGQYL